MSIADIRREYNGEGLNEGDIERDPFQLFAQWFDQAVNLPAVDPTAMTLATADADGQPSARIVLLKDFDEQGFVFYTNYESRKGRELLENPRAALLFYWPELNRQVRVDGVVERVDRAESDAYFHSRPRASQLGAWASHQSAVIESRDELDRRMEELTETYADAEIPLPEYWGGYRLRPHAIEFWQGRPNRLHDRILYSLGEEGAWGHCRLSP